MPPDENSTIAKFMPISSISVGERQRQSRADSTIYALASSIQAVGLLHAPVVSGLQLLAGAGRLQAMSILHAAGVQFTYGGALVPVGTTPAVDIGDLDPISAELVELDENIQREDLPWQDRVRALARLDALRKALNPAHTTKDTANEVFPDYNPARAYSKVRDATVLARYLDDPDIARAKTDLEAAKILARKQDAIVNARLASVVGAKAADERHTVIQGEAVDWLLGYKGERFACAVLDPPYGVGADGFGDAAGRLSGIVHQYDDSQGSFRSLMERVTPALFSVMAPEAHVYIWCDIDGFHFTRIVLESAGFWTHRTPLVNVKPEGGRVPWPEHGPRRCYELVAYAVKGKKPTTGIYPDVFESRLESGNVGHGAQKPIEAYMNLLKRSTRPGDLVLDCFAGTGTMIAAADELKLRSVTVEREPQYYGLCLKRLDALRGK